MLTYRHFIDIMTINVDISRFNRQLGGFMKIEDVDDLVVDGVDRRDYPDFSDAFFLSGEIDGRELTEDELDKLAEDYPCVLSELAHESLI